jgi:hypothetical protein
VTIKDLPYNAKLPKEYPCYQILNQFCNDASDPHVNIVDLIATCKQNTDIVQVIEHQILLSIIIKLILEESSQAKIAEVMHAKMKIATSLKSDKAGKVFDVHYEHWTKKLANEILSIVDPDVLAALEKQYVVNSKNKPGTEIEYSNNKKVNGVERSCCH